MVKELYAAGAPCVAMVATCLDPRGALRRLVAGRRARTLRKRVRDWRKLCAWLSSAGLGFFPQGLGGALNVLGYLEERALEPCARTVPASILGALRFFEHCGGVRRQRWCQGIRWSPAR